jgi:hypothetical protein
LKGINTNEIENLVLTKKDDYSFNSEAIYGKMFAKMSEIYKTEVICALRMFVNGLYKSSEVISGCVSEKKNKLLISDNSSSSVIISGEIQQSDPSTFLSTPPLEDEIFLQHPDFILSDDCLSSSNMNFKNLCEEITNKKVSHFGLKVDCYSSFTSPIRKFLGLFCFN